MEATEEGWKDLSLSHEQFKQAHGRHFAAAREEKPRPEPPSADVEQAASRFAQNSGLDQAEFRLLLDFVTRFDL